MRNLVVTSLLLIASIGWCAAKEATPVMNTAGIMKALPIYSNDLIDEAPEGKVVKGVRDCYSQYMMNGVSFRSYETGVLGEYVTGTDGNIYLRAVCYSAAQISSDVDTYLKLEKVDETTYVAHTPQLIWVDNSNEGSPFTAYAARVVFSQKSATNFGYEIQQNPDGTYETDIYFTMKDGKLMQRNMNTTEMNGETFAEELIGFTTSTGGWIGFGDGCIEIYQPEESATVLPAEATVEEKSMSYTLLHVRDVELMNATLLKYSEVGDEIYISNPSARTEQWIKGTINREKGTAVFKSQYLGLDAESGYATWFIPAKYDKYKDVFDEETGFGDWFRSYSALDEMVMSYNDGILSSPKGQALCFSHSPESILLTEVYADPCIKSCGTAPAKPAPVTFTKYEPYDDMWGFGVIGFAIPSMDENGLYINSDELYYNIYPDGSTTPFVFSPDDYMDMTLDSMTDVPYGYFEDFDFKVSGVNHTVYFYHDWKKVGVQVVYKHDGNVTRSDIVYSDNSSSGIVNPVGNDTDSPKTYKYIDNGEIIIVRDGARYNVSGFPVNK